MHANTLLTPAQAVEGVKGFRAVQSSHLALTAVKGQRQRLGAPGRASPWPLSPLVASSSCTHGLLDQARPRGTRVLGLLSEVTHVTESGCSCMAESGRF